MSPASYLAAPPRAVAGIVAPVFGAARIHDVWNWAIYGALIVGFLAGGGALALLLVRALAAWRSFKRLTIRQSRYRVGAFLNVLR